MGTTRARGGVKMSKEEEDEEGEEKESTEALDSEGNCFKVGFGLERTRPCVHKGDRLDFGSYSF